MDGAEVEDVSLPCVVEVGAIDVEVGVADVEVAAVGTLVARAAIPVLWAIEAIVVDSCVGEAATAVVLAGAGATAVVASIVVVVLLTVSVLNL